ncbi:two-component system sensor histidine kinase NtrB [Desulfovibrio inopinatus]|uniref:two-component system sensor histidine kinase NtrB n=1 Tax=Desulfovibrio inopinatus TaxID=102109 RepID=UPI0006840190|nr:PAS domain S-box protein [Desulfovibrio inopinatus]
MHDEMAFPSPQQDPELLVIDQERDIEHLRRQCLAMEAKLRDSEEKFRFVSETAVDAIIVTDVKGDITFWNNAAKKIFGYTEDEILGKPSSILMPQRYQQRHDDGIERYLKTGEPHHIGNTVEVEGLRKNGNEFPLELSLSTWTTNKGIFFAGIIRDISERKRLERLNEDVQRVVRHDLKSPLIGIGGFAKLLLKSDNLSDRENEWATMIYDMSKDLLNRLSLSRDIFKMEENTYELAPKPVNLIQVIKSVDLELHEPAEKKNIVRRHLLNTHPMDFNEEFLIDAEEHLIRSMIDNLVKNALEASPANEIVTISVSCRNPNVHIDIHNQGTVPEDIRERFFERYVTSGKSGGTGLGTYSAKLIAHAHHGDILFTTSENEGTHVVVTLPLKQPPNRPNP